MNNNTLDLPRLPYPVSGDVPNDETREAIDEARLGLYAGTLDMSSFDAFMASVNAIE